MTCITTPLMERITAEVTRDQHTHRRAPEWDIVTATRSNVLIVGPADALELSLALLMPHLDRPVCFWTRDVFPPASADVKTLVICGVDALSVQQQRDLSKWLEPAATATPRVVSTTSVPLFGRVTAGEFVEELYYRLNTVILEPMSRTLAKPRGVATRGRARLRARGE
jgi:hypothetical protein